MRGVVSESSIRGCVKRAPLDLEAGEGKGSWSKNQAVGPYHSIAQRSEKHHESLTHAKVGFKTFYTFLEDEASDSCHSDDNLRSVCHVCLYNYSLLSFSLNLNMKVKTSNISHMKLKECSRDTNCDVTALRLLAAVSDW